MYKLASCCLLFIGFLNPLLSLPVSDSREVSLQLSAPDEDARLTLQGLERASLLQVLPETVGVGRGDAPREAGPSTNVFNPRGNLRKFQAFSGQDPFNIFLSHLLAGTRKEYKKRGTPSECFWKYCV
ncbi:PREDICTED: urotensin-2 [Propithecus coquereli]|uniref:Urotensin-2 n=1 Tax=Propithecus coquereli TaxID=379532 RepID=A0A2K6F7K8_PROCO|nr:PREDICTED: urotensin-2 [Propithecus coquereli]